MRICGDDFNNEQNTRKIPHILLYNHFLAVGDIDSWSNRCVLEAHTVEIIPSVVNFAVTVDSLNRLRFFFLYVHHNSIP